MDYTLGEMFAEERKITGDKFDAAQKSTAAAIKTAQQKTIRQVKVLLKNGVEKQIRLLAGGHAQILARNRSMSGSRHNNF